MSKKSICIPLIYALVALAIVIIAIFNAEIINTSKYRAYKHRIKSDNQNVSYQAGNYDMGNDVFCYTKQGRNQLIYPPQVTRQNIDCFSSLKYALATHFDKVKGLTFQLKVLLNNRIALLKYRFFTYKILLEVHQARVMELAKFSQNKDSLSMLRGLVLGEKETDNSYYSSFGRAGMIHVLVASGFNISLLVGYFSKILVFLPKRERIRGLLSVIWFYTWFLGGEAPLLRAALMMSINLLLLEKGLRTHSRRILFVSATILLVIFPDLLESLSFWFSFLATAGLVFFHNRFLLFSSSSEGMLSFFKTEFISSLSAQLLIIPLVINFFNELNWLGFITNSLFLFPIAWFTQVGFGLITLLGLLKGTFLVFILHPFSLIYRYILLFFIFIIGQTKRLFFLQYFVSSEEKSWFLLCWFLFLMGTIAVLRGNSRKKGVFFHESI